MSAAKPPRFRNVTSIPLLGSKPQGIVLHMTNKFTKEDYDMALAGLNSSARLEDGVITKSRGNTPPPEHVEINWLSPDGGNPGDFAQYGAVAYDRKPVAQAVRVDITFHQGQVVLLCQNCLSMKVLTMQLRPYTKFNASWGLIMDTPC